MSSTGIAKDNRENLERCHRCGGLLVLEEVFEIRSFDWRCVSCGERIDAVILAHRRQDVAHVEVGKLA